MSAGDAKVTAIGPLVSNFISHSHQTHFTHNVSSQRLKGGGRSWSSRIALRTTAGARKCSSQNTLRIEYKDPNGTERTWESAERTTRPANSDIDGVGIVAILEKPTGRIHVPYQTRDGLLTYIPRT